MTHGSLFSGIGGFDLAAQWMGWENKFHCEWNTFGQKVLHHYWPQAEQFTDITKTDFTKYANRIDILTGGFPCQPYSSAGKRLGKEDERHLWPEMLRAIREIQPRWVVGENVLGLVNWSGGLVFHEVQADLEAEGYEVQPYVLPAVSVNAPHRRDRVWFVAYSNNSRTDIGMRSQSEWAESNNKWKGQSFSKHRQNGINGDVADSNFTRLHKQHISTESSKKRTRCRAFNERGDFTRFPTQSPICIGDDGIPDRLDSITFPKWRNESIKAGGNAIVPQVVYQIFKTIEQYERINTPDKNS
jgi:DNA (cytosine-5)-methyltransferase 1